jgi:hypothetical protein
MTFTVALLILALGVLIGYPLPGLVARLNALLQRHRRRPRLLRPWTPDPARTAPAPTATRARHPHG